MRHALPYLDKSRSPIARASTRATHVLRDRGLGGRAHFQVKLEFWHSLISLHNAEYPLWVKDGISRIEYLFSAMSAIDGHGPVGGGSGHFEGQ